MYYAFFWYNWFLGWLGIIFSWAEKLGQSGPPPPLPAPAAHLNVQLPINSVAVVKPLKCVLRGLLYSPRSGCQKICLKLLPPFFSPGNAGGSCNNDRGGLLRCANKQPTGDSRGKVARVFDEIGFSFKRWQNYGSISSTKRLCTWKDLVLRPPPSPPPRLLRTASL